VPRAVDKGEPLAGGAGGIRGAEGGEAEVKGDAALLALNPDDRHKRKHKITIAAGTVYEGLRRACGCLSRAAVETLVESALAARTERVH
jgi:hypothetical protein